MHTTSARLHPMGLGELLDTTFALCRENFPLLAGIVAVLAIPQALLSIVIQLATSSTTATTTGTFPTVTTTVHTTGILGLGAITALITLVFSSLMTGALAQAISARYLGRPITIGQAFRSVGVGTLVSLALASILGGLVVVIGLVFVLIPGIYLLVRFLFIPQAIVLERRPIFSAFSRSGELVSGSWWRVAGYGLALFILVAVIQAAVGGAIAAALAFGAGTGGRIAAAVINALISVLVQPFELGALTLLYYDLRIRKEGFDLEHLARHLD